MKGAAAAVGASYRNWLAWPRRAAFSRSATFTRSRRWLRHVSDRYRHSLQFRVVSATLIMSAVVVSVLGYILMTHLVAGIYTNMKQTSVNIADGGLTFADSQIAFSQAPNSGTASAMYSLGKGK